MPRFYVHCPRMPGVPELDGQACVEIRPYPEDTPAESLLSFVGTWSPCAVTLLGWPPKVLSILRMVYERAQYNVVQGMTHEESFFYIELREPTESEASAMVQFRSLASIAAAGFWLEYRGESVSGTVTVDPYESYCRSHETVVAWEAEKFLNDKAPVPCSPVTGGS